MNNFDKKLLGGFVIIICGLITGMYFTIIEYKKESDKIDLNKKDIELYKLSSSSSTEKIIPTILSKAKFYGLASALALEVIVILYIILLYINYLYAKRDKPGK